MAIIQGDDEWASEPAYVTEVGPWVEGMDPAVAELIALASLRQPTLSMDDCYPEEMFWVTAGWQATAIMVWREYENGSA